MALRNSNYCRMLASAKPYKGLLATAILCMIGSSLCGGGWLTMIIPLVDGILAGKPINIPNLQYMPPVVAEFVGQINTWPRMQLLHMVVVAVVSLTILKALFSFLQGLFMSDLGERVARDLRGSMYNHIVGLSHDFFVRTRSGVIVTRVASDTAHVQAIFNEGLMDLLYQPLQLLVYIGLLVWIKMSFDIPWALVLVTFIVLPMVVYPVWRIGKRIRKFTTQTQESLEHLHDRLAESISGYSVIKAFVSENYERLRFGRVNETRYQINMKLIKRQMVLSPLTEVVVAVCLAIVLKIGGGAVVAGELSPGAFVTFLAALLSLIRPFKRLSRVHAVNQRGLAAAERMFELLDTTPSIMDRPDARVLPAFHEAIQFDQVAFAYDDNQVLEGMNFTVRAGQTVACVGPSGVGKTTLLNLIARFYDATAGRVIIDGHDVRDVTIDSLRKQIGIVTQETILFHDTVGANIAYGTPDATHDEIVRAAEAANAHGFIKGLPDGYETLIGERGFRLSGGERQRIAIARALLKDPAILLLDEATSQLDSAAERVVQEALERLMAGRTVFVIAHRLSTVTGADQIVVLDQGHVAQVGNHQTLLAQEGPYQRLYRLQFASNKENEVTA